MEHKDALKDRIQKDQEEKKTEKRVPIKQRVSEIVDKPSAMMTDLKDKLRDDVQKKASLFGASIKN